LLNKNVKESIHYKVTHRSKLTLWCPG